MVDWNNSPAVDLEHRWSQSEDGMHHRTRELQFPEIFGNFDPDMLAYQEAPPSEVQVAFEETMGEAARPGSGGPDGKPRLILRFHPWFKRWSFFEWCWDAALKGNAWRCVYICCEASAVDSGGPIPEDLRDPRYSEIAKRIGAYKLPNRRDFEEYREVADRRFRPLLTEKEATRARQKEALKARDEAIRAEKEMWRQRDRDFMDYGFAMLCRDINRAHGSMQGLPFLPGQDMRLEDGRVHWPVLNEQGVFLYYRRRPMRKLWSIQDDYTTRRLAGEFGPLSDDDFGRVLAVAVYKEFDAEVPATLKAFEPGTDEWAERERILRAGGQFVEPGQTLPETALERAVRHTRAARMGQEKSL